MTDILLTDSELIQVGGDFKTGNPVNEYIYYIVASDKGHWKQFPLVGVGIENYFYSNLSPAIIERDIAAQLKADVFPNPMVSVKDWPTIIINDVILKLG